MGIHELTTNAVKYGALSTFEGHVDIRWRVERNEGQEQVVLEWVERGGPPVVTPVDRGFGMTLIERGLRQDMGADVRIEFASSGVVATLVAPLPQVSIEAPHKSAS
jgi:two-component sensor histidine kinase